MAAKLVILSYIYRCISANLTKIEYKPNIADTNNKYTMAQKNATINVI